MAHQEVDLRLSVGILSCSLCCCTYHPEAMICSTGDHASSTRKPQITVVRMGQPVTTKKLANEFAISVILTSIIAVVEEGEEKRPKRNHSKSFSFPRAHVLRLTSRKGKPCCSGAGQLRQQKQARASMSLSLLPVMHCIQKTCSPQDGGILSIGCNSHIRSYSV